MKLESTISRTAPTLGFILDVETSDRAVAEAGEYDWRQISPGYFLCIHEENAYVISEYMKKVGCSCADMSFRKKGKEACKHAAAFMALPDISGLKGVDVGMEQLLRAAGWTGTILQPPKRPEQARRSMSGSSRQRIPNIHDPDRKPGKKAATRAEKTEMYESMTPEEIMRNTSEKDLEIYAKKGAPLARKELQRREAEKAVSA